LLACLLIAVKMSGHGIRTIVTHFRIRAHG
jgi:hypothetical protein